MLLISISYLFLSFCLPHPPTPHFTHPIPQESKEEKKRQKGVAAKKEASPRRLAGSEPPHLLPSSLT